ncbi:MULTISPECIES: hypothetical protein [Streptomyces]|uniref:Secreted protein n=1 Tax=Streptomyces avermitilis TaxID=33903 RepID=A0A4D4N2I8_STRAX|nr:MULTISPECIES: hypothetical protein [Streptomyces]MYS97837.1 hypothetical protein [Streptomyces sp. SID5469]OOV24233.1 hypothetical protein SM007_30990 [Streptomyces avermitilis]BBJ49992.1 hypothetical protein SAVMC3_26210 [Streptomyces avermitilis]GDY62008.1 hypothetical protein SAV14893_014010 [Streptomyces avermitilis]GDY77885.1 hypothetical protein SAV31267_073700 [Streptomyces avermitilis]
MRAAAPCTAAGSLLLTGLAAAPAGGVPAAPGDPELRGTVTVPLDHARPGGMPAGGCQASPATSSATDLRRPV